MESFGLYSNLLLFYIELSIGFWIIFDVKIYIFTWILEKRKS